MHDSQHRWPHCSDFTNMQVWPDAHPVSMWSSQSSTLVKLTHMVHLFCLRISLKCMPTRVMMEHSKLVILQKCAVKHPLLGKKLQVHEHDRNITLTSQESLSGKRTICTSLGHTSGWTPQVANSMLFSQNCPWWDWHTCYIDSDAATFFDVYYCVSYCLTVCACSICC